MLYKRHDWPSSKVSQGFQDAALAFTRHTVQSDVNWAYKMPTAAYFSQATFNEKLNIML